MTIRERIADWLTGGDYTLEREYSRNRLDWALEEYRQRQALADALSEIAASETPGANATVKRMARVARDALND
jgi:hypothetical protein